jgi:hypothetical protein
MIQKSRSLISTMINQKGGLTQSAEEIKTKAKQDIAAPTDYNKMIFQLRVFTALLEILFGKESIPSKQVGKFMRLIKVNSISYKGCIAFMIHFCPRSFGQCAPASNFSWIIAPMQKRERMWTTPSSTSWQTTETSSLTGLAQLSCPVSKKGQTRTQTPRWIKGKRPRNERVRRQKRRRMKQGGTTINEDQCVDFKM